MTETRTVTTESGATVTSVVYREDSKPLATLVLGHGAGASQFSAFMVSYARALSERGLMVVTFNFPYTERTKKLPDPQPVLESCFRSVLTDLSESGRMGETPLFIGGKSMGGRMATHVAASLAIDAGSVASWPTQLRGLVLLGYPLHPPGRAQQVRVSHLPSISHPMLFVQGTKDAFGTPTELRAFVDVLPAPCEIYPVDQAGHSFDVLKRSGIPQDAVHAAVQDRIVEWIRATASSTIPRTI
jgi:predicted alpha/beta-hydrolase family hydrolase